MKLKGRLKLIYDKICSCETVCDIGTDHAYIPIYILKNMKCKKAVATDVVKGPIQIALKNIRKFNMEHCISTRLGNGLEPLKESEIDVIIIAGMGGVLITEILSRGYEKARRANKLVLQPMNSTELVRQWIYENGFKIDDEELVNEGKKIYNVIIASWDGIVRNLDEVLYYVGEKLIKKKDPLLTLYIGRIISKLDKIIKGQGKSQNENNEIIRYVRIKQKLGVLLEKIK